MSAARWGEGGEPENVEAAIADALEWLVVLQRQPLVRRDLDNETRLRDCMAALAAYGDAETRDQYAPERAASGRREEA